MATSFNVANVTVVGSPILWGIVCFLLGLVGALHLYIAEKNTKKQVQANAQANGMWTAPQYGAPAYGAPGAPPAGQWAPPPPASRQWAPPTAPTVPPGPPRPNVGGTDIIPGQH